MLLNFIWAFKQEFNYLDKLAHIQVIISCQYSIAQMCTREDTVAQYLGAPYLDEVMSHKELTAIQLIFDWAI